MRGWRNLGGLFPRRTLFSVRGTSSVLLSQLLWMVQVVGFFLRSVFDFFIPVFTLCEAGGWKCDHPCRKV